MRKVIKTGQKWSGGFWPFSNDEYFAERKRKCVMEMENRNGESTFLFEKRSARGGQKKIKLP